MMAVRCARCGAHHLIGEAPVIDGCVDCQPPERPIYRWLAIEDQDLRPEAIKTGARP